MLTSLGSTDARCLQARFVSLLPRIEAGARIYFRDIRCAVRKADFVAEAVAISWKWFCRLMAKGKDVTKFVGALARMAARAVRAGRRVGAGERANDIMSSLAQRRHGFTVQGLPPTRRSHEALNGDGFDQRLQDVLEDRLKDNTVTAIPDQVAFRADFPAWLKTLTPRERKIIRIMMLNERTKNLSRKFGITPGRVSQMRREFRDNWRLYIGDVEEKVAV
jgi:hypothetical protein